MGNLEELDKLQKLKESGTLTTEEFEKEKARILNRKGNNKKTVFIVIAILVAIFIACIFIFLLNRNEPMQKNDDNIGVQKTNNNNENKENNNKNDTNLGLRSIKIDDTSKELTEEQKLVLQYFDDDYVDINNYKFLMRYPQLFKETLVKFSGRVTQVLVSNDTDFEAVVWIGKSPSYYAYWETYRNGTSTSYEEYVNKTINNLVYIKGKQQEQRIVKDDWLTIYGRYKSIDTYSSTNAGDNALPTIEYFQSIKHKDDGDYSGKPDGTVDKFDLKFIRKVAKAIFNDAVTVREPNEDEAVTTSSSFMNNPTYICELDNQSDANFSKYFFNRNKGLISDTRNSDGNYVYANEDGSGINRYIEFAPDFEHFFLFKYDTKGKYLNIAYYDKEFKRIWSRDFENTLNATYDFTENNIYLIANQNLYIIDTSTGKDIYEKKYIGNKTGIRKLRDGLLLLEDVGGSTSKSNCAMKTDLQGNILWNTEVNFSDIIDIIQVKSDSIIIGTTSTKTKYVVLNPENGEIKLEAEQAYENLY